MTKESDGGNAVTVCRFALQRFDPASKQPIAPPIPVEMRAPGPNGFDGVLHERDWVEVPGEWRGQPIHPEWVYVVPRATYFIVHGARIPQVSGGIREEPDITEFDWPFTPTGRLHRLPPRRHLGRVVLRLVLIVLVILLALFLLSMLF
jgi:hypothetical protein